MYEMKKFNF